VITEGCSSNGCSGDGQRVEAVDAPSRFGAVLGRCRRIAWSWPAVFLVVAGVSLLQADPALALTQRGHVFSFHFGSIVDPTGVAVNDASGEVYVASKKRVEAFEPVVSGGELVGETQASSWEAPSISAPDAIAVDNSTESSDPSAGDVYVVSNEKAIYKLDAEGKELETIKGPGGTSTTKKFAAIMGIAVDLSGHVFVYEEGGKVYELSDALTNEAISEFITPPESEALHAGKPGFAVDSKGNFYIGSGGEAGDSALQAGLIQEIKNEYKEQTSDAGAEAPFAVIAKLDGAADTILVPALDYEFASAVAVNPLDQPSNEVDEADDAYIVNVSGVAGEKTSTVAEFGPDEGTHETGTVEQRFTAPELRDGDAIAVDSKTGAVYVADAASNSDNVDVFQLEKPGVPKVENLSAQSATGAEVLSAKVDPAGADTDYHIEYGTSPCASSSCADTAAVNIGEGFSVTTAIAELSGLQAGTYYYRVVAQNAYGTTQSAEQTFAVVAATTGLLDGRAWELVSPPDKDGAEPEALTREGGAIQAAANGNAITYVADGPMPAGAGTETEGNRAPEYPQILSTRGAKGWSSKDIATPVTAGTGVEVGAPPEYQFFSPNLALALVQPAVGAPESGALADPPLALGETQDKSIYLRDDTPLDNEEFLPLQPGASESAAYQAAKGNAETAASLSPGYVALVTALHPPGGGSSEFGGGLQEGVEFVSANTSLSDVVLKSWRDAPGLYEWVGLGQPLKPVSVAPKTGALLGPTHAFLGGPEGVDTRNAISSGGTRVVWSSNQGIQGFNLFVRDTQTDETLQLDTFHGVPPTEGKPEAMYQTANSSGSMIFFTDTLRLTPTSRATPASPDLYVAELHGGESAGSPLTATLTDLTPREGAKVQANEYQDGGVIGVGEEGASELSGAPQAGNGELNVYFVADGALAPGATPGYCSRTLQEERPKGTTCNLFVRHYNGREWQPTRFIAALSSEDQPDWWSDGQDDDLAELTSRVSPNGKYLAFMSNRSLTGYDNEDVSSEQGHEVRLDEEVYLYDAATGSLTCASCNPSGARPTGVLDTKGGGEGIGLLVSRPKTWELQGVDHWLAGSLPGWTSLSADAALYQSRYLSNEGRLFFNSADPLAPIAKPTRPEQVGEETQEVGVENVYEYEPGGLGSCGQSAGCVGLISSGTSGRESAFLDASANGQDVFFLTAEPLTSQDKDSNFDIYDAHVCEASSPCVTPPTTSASQCEELGGEYCQPGYVSPPTFVSPDSTTSGSSNLVEQVHVLGEKEAVTQKAKPLTRAQKFEKALKLCKKDKKKSKRLACEKQARKKYGVHEKAKKSSEANAR
jgi:hypothetical protein